MSKLAFVYPGQGSQQPGMGQFLVDNFNQARLAFEEASEAIKTDLKKLCFEGSSADLQLTHNTQPAILVSSVATARVLAAEFGLKPQVSAGHSIGEYAACVVSHVLSLADATFAVRERGLAMQSAVPLGQGGMAALMGLSPEQAEQLCHFIREQKVGWISCANFNTKGQIVVSGHQSAIEYLTTQFKSQDLWGEGVKFKAIALSVSAPFHCPLMQPAQDKMQVILNGIHFNPAQSPIIQNVNAQIETQADVIKNNLISQISAPVLWTQTMSQFASQEVTHVIEVGHGKVLQGLFKKADLPYALEVKTTSSLEELKALVLNS